MLESKRMKSGNSLVRLFEVLILPLKVYKYIR